MFVTLAFASSATTTTETPVTGETAEGTVHTETGVPQQAEHGGAFPPFDPTHYPSQILWLAISFGVFYVLISRMISPRIASIIESRQNTISSDLAAANKMKADADAAIEAYETELASAKAKAGAIAGEARDAAKAKADAERAALEASLSEKISAAEANIAGIKAKALAEVGGIAVETAQNIVQQLTGAKVSKADATAAVKSVSGN